MGRSGSKQMYVMIVQARKQLSSPSIEHCFIWYYLKVASHGLDGVIDPQIN